MGWFKRWHRARILRRAQFNDSAWADAVNRYPFISAMPLAERARLKQWVILFLHQKGIHGAGGLAVRDEIRYAIAAQACILILNLDLDYYRGWQEVIVYPDEFVAEYEHMDDDGVMHHIREPMAGESWLQGPVILSWADAAAPEQAAGYNVIIHEFAHKLDMLNGDANGFPPLHAGMSREAWSGSFASAYADFSRRVAACEQTAIDPYAAENPAEFFAVTSEAFFETPQTLHATYPEVYRQLALFFRQDPALRMRCVGASQPSVQPPLATAAD
jgi:Mlc titration factor MtfA (ptsG expression regulator)